MRAPAPLECVTVDESERREWQSVQLSATLPCDLHLALVRLHLLDRVFISYAIVTRSRELWSRTGCHNRIRHVGPPPQKKNNLLQQLKLTQQATAYAPDPRRP